MKNQSKKIRDWLQTISATSTLHDIHIDEIDLDNKNKASWVVGGLNCLRLACDIRDADFKSLSVALAFSLTSRNVPVGLTCTSQSEFEREFSITPPSLYAWRRGQSPIGNHVGV